MLSTPDSGTTSLRILLAIRSVSSAWRFAIFSMSSRHAAKVSFATQPSSSSSLASVLDHYTTANVSGTKKPPALEPQPVPEATPRFYL